MNFEEAHKHLKKGKSIKRPDWDFPLRLITIEKYMWAGEEAHLTKEEINAEDWELCDE